MEKLLEEYKELIVERDNVIKEMVDLHWITDYYIYLRVVTRAIYDIRIEIIQINLV